METSDFGAKTSRSSSKFKFLIQNLNFKLLFALLTSNITYIKRLRSMTVEEASTDEKTVKNSEKQVLAPKLAVTAQNSNVSIQNLNLRGGRSVWNSKTTLHAQHTSSSNPFSSYTTRQTRSANKQNRKNQ